MVTPLVTNFQYYPILFDIFDVKSPLEKKITAGGKEIDFDFNDEVFGQYKNMHFNKTLMVIDDDIKKFKSTSKVSKFQENSK